MNFSIGNHWKLARCHLWVAHLVISLCIFPILTGCGNHRATIEDSLAQQSQYAAVSPTGNLAYRVGCPDVLEIRFSHRSQWNCFAPVDVEGRVKIDPLGHVRVEGRTLPQITDQIAVLSGMPNAAVQVRVHEYRSQQIYVFGQVKGNERAVEYRGPETALQLLKRIGGITAGAEPEHVYVVRAHLANGKRPEVYHIDLSAIVLNNDHRTNIPLLPFDQIYVGETRQALVERCIPKWLRPMFRMICDTRPQDNPHKSKLGKRLSELRRSN